MTRERIVGFLLGVSVGTAVGFYLRPFDPGCQEDGATDRARENHGMSATRRDVPGAAGAPRPRPESVTRSSIS